MTKPKSRKVPPCPNPKPDEVRDRIVNAAFKAFMEHGYAGASTLEIATLAKVSKRELYAHFENKRALLEAGIKHRSAQMRTPLDLAEPSNAQTLSETLRAYGRTLLAGITDTHVLAVHRLAISESARSPELAATLDENGRGANRAALIATLKKAQKRGLIQATDPEQLATLYNGLLFGDLMPRLLLRVVEPPDAKEIARRSDRATELFLRLCGSARG
jgi:AcrR family transcriptional regulator